MNFVTLKTLIIAASIAVLGQSCGSAKYGFGKKKNNNNQDVQQEQPKGNVSPNEWRGTNGFWIKGTPGTAEAGSNITFTGSCGNDTSGELTWKFGDGKTGKGTNIKHRFDKQGTYRIEGECKYGNGTTQKGTITITILPKKVNPNGNGGTTQRPGQNPNQSPNGTIQNGTMPKQTTHRCQSYYYSCR